MKKLIFVFLVLLSFGLSAQQILFPYRAGKLFGLKDQSDKVIVKPEYEHIQWVADHYFITTKKVEVEPLLLLKSNAYIKRSELAEYKGVIRDGKVIIEPQVYTQFQIEPELFILGLFYSNPEEVSKDQKQYDELVQKPNHIRLFDDLGKRIGEKDYLRLEVVGVTGKQKSDKQARFVLFFAQDFNQASSLMVYDAQERKIKEYLTQNMTDFFVLDNISEPGHFYISYQDKNLIQKNQVIIIDRDYFKLEDAMAPQRNAVGVDKNAEFSKSETFMPPGENSTIPQTNKQHEVFVQQDGKFYFQNQNKEKTELKSGNDIAYLFSDIRQKEQIRPLLYKQNKKFGWMRGAEHQPAIYDSMAYFGAEHFLACKKVDEKLKCGLLNEQFEVQIPIDYDSIFGRLKKFEYFQNRAGDYYLEANFDYFKRNLLKTRPYFISATNQLQTYKNGKAGLMTLSNQVLIPNEYDEIGQNGVNSMKGNTQFVVLKKEGLYGLILTIYDANTKKELTETIEPIFPYYPAYYYPDYYGQKNYRLFVLFDENGHFMCYANEFGKVFMN